MDMSKALAANMFSANCNSAMINDLQQLGFALQSNLLKSDSASYCARCDPEIRRLEAQLHESLANQDALETELRWALESKLAAELSLAEHLTHTRSLIDSLGNATPRGPLGWMPATSPPDQDEDSLSLFSQPLISSPMKVDHRHENGKHCDEVTKELEMQLARMSYQFQTLAECYSLTAHRLQQAQNEVYKLNLENLELQAANGELIKGYRLKERQLQQILLDRTALAMPGTEFNTSALPLSYGNTPLMCEQTFSHGSSPELKQGVCHSDAADNAPSKVGPGAYSGPRAREHQDQTTSLSQLSIADNSTAADTSTLPPATLQHGRVLSERTNISNLVIPKRDLKTWYLPSKFPSRDHQQFDSPGAASACAMKANAESAPTVATLPARPLCEDLTQSTDCTVVLDTDPLILNSKSATISEGSGSKVHGSVMLPKSISIRASGTSVVTVMANLSCQTKKKRSVSPESTDSLQSLVLSPVSPLRPHRLRLSPLMGREELLTSDSAGKEGSDNDQVECDVFDQGMYKTELCNKWQEGGHCPYGNRCQFAHGVDELRPVLRHPRYKTELCRMVANGDKCPYGHRCHFRHSMTKEERASLL